MDRRLLNIVLCLYAGLFIITGALSFILSIGGSMPHPAQIKEIYDTVTDENARKMYIDAFVSTNSRFSELGKIAINSFQVVVGALIGFLSGLAARATGNASDNRVQNTNTDASSTRP